MPAYFRVCIPGSAAMCSAHIRNRSYIDEVQDLDSDPGERENLRGTAAEHELLNLLISRAGPLPETA